MWFVVMTLFSLAFICICLGIYHMIRLVNVELPLKARVKMGLMGPFCLPDRGPLGAGSREGRGQIGEALVRMGLRLPLGARPRCPVAGLDAEALKSFPGWRLSAVCMRHRGVQRCVVSRQASLVRDSEPLRASDGSP